MDIDFTGKNFVLTDAPTKLSRVIRNDNELHGKNKYNFYDWTLFGDSALMDKIRKQLEDFNMLKESGYFIKNLIKSEMDEIPFKIGIYYNDFIRDYAPIVSLNILRDKIKELDEKCNIIIITSNPQIKLYFDKFSNDINVKIFVLSNINIVKKILSKLERLVYTSLRILIGIIRLIKYNSKIKRTDILLLKYDNYKRIHDHYGDPDLELIEKYLYKANKGYYYMSFLHENTNNIGNLLHFIKDDRAIPFEIFYVISWVKSLGKYNYRLDDYNYLNTDYPQMLNIFLDFYNYRRILLAMKASKLIINLFSPQYIFLGAEYSKMPKTLIFEAKNKKIISIAVQHGVIHRYHVGYNYPELDFSKFKPDYFLTYGKAYTKVLRDIKYLKSNRILTFGNPRFSFKKENLWNKKLMNIKKNYKIIVITSSDPKRHIIRDSLLASIEDNVTQYLKNNIYCFIKLHPNYDRLDGFYNKYKQKYPFSKVNIIKSSIDLYSLLYFADLHISVTSTCIQESLCLGTPTIEIIDLPQSYLFSRDYKQFLGEGIVRSVSRGELLSNIYDFFTGNPLKMEVDTINRLRDSFNSTPKVQEIFNFIGEKNC